ncbi:hypothetical protein [Xanthomonas phage MET23-P3]|nr:hypothetical protein [Xanthomonas phage MET23-P3]
MRITTKTSPQGVAIEYVEPDQGTSERDIQHFRTMIELGREKQNRRDAQRAPVAAGQERDQ